MLDDGTRAIVLTRDDRDRIIRALEVWHRGSEDLDEPGEARATLCTLGKIEDPDRYNARLAEMAGKAPGAEQHRADVGRAVMQADMMLEVE